MSFHYSSSPHNSAAMDMPHSAYMSSYPPPTNSTMEVRPLQQPVPPAPYLPAQLPAPLPPLSAYPLPATHSPLSKRRESLSKALKLRRSHSTPNVRPQGMNEPDTDPLGLSGEKKRNRLGYARTNMACGNCRKRKIRCQPVKDDGRCSQCIRLKKDCQFYAVDQQPPPPSVVRAGSRPLPKAMLASTATSPPIAPGYLGDMQTHQSYQSRERLASHDMRPPSMRPDTYLEDPKLISGASAVRTYSYGQSMENWAPTAGSPTAKQGDLNASWRSYPPESPVVSAYAPHSAAASTAWTTSPLEATVGQEGTSRSGDAWSPYQQPARSMSFSGEHSMQYAATPSRTYDRKASVASDIYQPTSIETIPPTVYTAWQQPYQPWYAEGGQPVSSASETPTQIDGVYFGR
ncbi:hypothetical protein NUW58_g641 [Xylaria curta]|uniref:Uncharacterized protein n=1 Tax=Xylaria curta TaxID=42375 RepID=A0ACC1PNG7_9PEZI|nr:hypothetical protein NUW58_g641 [Xylaria curta]